MKVAAYQAPLLAEDGSSAIGLMHEQVRHCEARGVSILCFPEAILGGLADYSDNPGGFALRSDNGQLASVLAPLASDTLTSIVGFTELDRDGGLWNAAAVYQRGRVTGIYRKIHPAIRHSVYRPGSDTPVFRAGELTFGIVICNDSNYPELPRRMAAQGASALFIPTNNALPNDRASAKLNSAARRADIALAIQTKCWVIRADVAGGNGDYTSFGCSEIIDSQGNVVLEAPPHRAHLLVTELPSGSMREVMPLLDCTLKPGDGSDIVAPDLLETPRSE